MIAKPAKLTNLIAIKNGTSLWAFKPNGRTLLAFSIIASIVFLNFWDSNKSYLSNSWPDVTYSPIWINKTLNKLLYKTLLVGSKNYVNKIKRYYLEKAKAYQKHRQRIKIILR